MKNIFEKIRISIYLLMCILLTFLIFAYLNEVFVDSRATWLAGILTASFIVICNYLSRKHITNLIIFVFIHLLMICFPFILPINIFARGILATIAFSYLLMGITYWKTEFNEEKNALIQTPLGLIIAFLLVYIHSSFYFSESLTMYAYLSGIAYFILFYIREYLDKFRSMSLNTTNNKNEILNTFSTNFSLVVFLNAIIVIVISASYIFYSDNLVNKLGKILQKFFKFIFSFFTKNGDGVLEVEPETTAPPTQGQEIEIDTTPYVDEKRDFPIIDLIFEIAVYIIFIALFCTIIYLLYKFIKHYLNRNRKTDDIIEKVENVDKKNTVKKKVQKKRLSIFTPNDIKLRKIYTKKINNILAVNHEIIVKDTFTTKEISSSVSKEPSVSKENINILTNLYRKARYSNKEITKSDIEIAGKL